MKSKALILVSTMLMALALMAQSTPQTTTPSDNDAAKTCACCNHGQADGETNCYGKDAKSCAQNGHSSKGACCQGKDGTTCPMMAKDPAGKMTCCADGKCNMASKKDGTSCCGGSKMCSRPESGA